MPTTFPPYQPDQLLLLSPDLREWLPPGHLAHRVSDLVDALDLNAFYAPYEGAQRSHHLEALDRAGWPRAVTGAPSSLTSGSPRASDAQRAGQGGASARRAALAV